MSRLFEELANAPTPIGVLSLRRRLEPSLQIDVYDVKLGDEYLMTSLFTAGEEALAEIGLAAIVGDDLDVLVGGLGLGYTAQAALRDHRVRSLHVVDALAPVIDWHRRHLVPLGAELTADPRVELVHDDFFALVRDGITRPDLHAQYDVILVDIDHTPLHHLDDQHGDFYDVDGIRRLRALLRRGGTFALWSDDPPDAPYLERLVSVFPDASAEIVCFPNLHTGGEAAITIYVAPT